jgi:hypothetical protein
MNSTTGIVLGFKNNDGNAPGTHTLNVVSCSPATADPFVISSGPSIAGERRIAAGMILVLVRRQKMVYILRIKYETVKDIVR